ncbi:MAG: RNA polymerase factor sigma-32 [Rhodospirillales bacterium RIFCSPLOWO2_12_FULL_58_28]|nr:MAG: RNA polymerase factor sigma-32 [Rhodospirillales bacterium RIFCSPLOWO2_02_FULL_58_16]OHC79330.1 MAG: RNA polymerase factor sigma-32 [Rhodospirillales bacterium RIFCSPLOWO2_12_FULL_58_28]
MSMKLPTVPMDGGLSGYFRDIWKFPILEPQEEYMLARRWREHNDMEAAHKLVTSHLRLVARIAVGFRGYGLPVSDLVSEGTIGLMKAVKKFEPERGFRLSTYAMWWIKAAITEYVLRSWSMVKLGTMAAQKKLFFSLRKIKSGLNILDGEELTSEQAAELSRKMKVSEREIIDMNRRLTVRDLSLNAPLSREETMEFQDTLVDESSSPETLCRNKEEMEQRMVFLKKAVAGLSQRERRIFTERRLKDDPMTLEDLGTRYGISRERVRQIEVRAFEKVKAAINVNGR